MSMENMPNGVERNVLLEALKTRGIEDKETKEMLLAWTDQKGQEAMAIGTRKAQIEFELDRAALYEEAGIKDAALETLIELVDIVIANEPDSEEMREFRNKAEEKIASLQ